MTYPSPAVPAQPSERFRFRNLDWTNTIGIGAMHLGCLLAPFFFSWSGLIVALFLWWCCGGLGICLCFHRLLTHRSFKTPRVIKYFLTLLGTMNWQGSPIKWVGTHRLHHKHSDDDEDPHSPRHGFNWAHMLWCLTKDSPGANPRLAALDLKRDLIMKWIDRFHYVPQFVLAGVLFAVGHFVFEAGVSWVIWGCCVRTVWVYHVTWFVNSASHTWGYQSFDTGDNSRNTWWVALLGFGEGWHNNHHAVQRSAAHGMRWWEIDTTWWVIKVMSWIGLASEIVGPDGRRR